MKRDAMTLRLPKPLRDWLDRESRALAKVRGVRRVPVNTVVIEHLEAMREYKRNLDATVFGLPVKKARA